MRPLAQRRRGRPAEGYDLHVLAYRRAGFHVPAMMFMDGLDPLSRWVRNYACLPAVQFPPGTQCLVKQVNGPPAWWYLEFQLAGRKLVDMRVDPHAPPPPVPGPYLGGPR